MIIRSLRLKNVKSYGEGPDGTGVTVTFQPGVNRIAGLNGNGKTTLIECLGYALFRAEPFFEERFDVDTYLLRHGAKAAEIAVTFSHGGTTYRIERGLGLRNKLRDKVVQTNDGSICAEGSDEVAAFLCKLFVLPGLARLSELFSKLVGVKQGRLALPFDSVARAAKDFFEPLLEVEVFRQCHQRLLPVVNSFERNRQELATKAAGVAERIQDRADSPAEFARAQTAVSGLTADLALAAKARDAALKEREAREALEKAFKDAQTSQQLAEAAATTAAELRQAAETRLAEAESALTTVAESTPAHDAFLAAEQALKQLAKRRKHRDQLQAKRATADAESKDRHAKAKAQREQAAEFRRQRVVKATEHASLQEAVASLHDELQADGLAFQQAQTAAQVAEDQRADLNAWVQGLPRVSDRLAKIAAAIDKTHAELVAWDPVRLATARTAEKSAAEALRAAQELLAAAVARRESLAQQLEMISGGVCPFLRETCHQFDPAKVQADQSELDREIGSLAEQVSSREKELAAARRTLAPLDKEEHQLAGKSTRRDQDLDQFRTELVSATPESLAETIAGLRRWHERIPASPLLAVGGSDPIAPGRVRAVFESFVALAAAVHVWWDETAPLVQGCLARRSQEREERAAREARLETHSTQLASLAAEASALEASAAARAADADRLEGEATEFDEALQQLEAALQPFDGLDADTDTLSATCDANRAGHECYLKATSLANDVEPRRAHLSQQKDAEAKALAELQERNLDSARAQEAHDPDKSKAAREDYERKLGEVKTVEANLEHSRKELEDQQRRVTEWQETCAEKAKLDEAIGRCAAAIEVTELARKTLQNAAPAVAQHLCDRIAARAQAVFNQISPDPVELSWDAKSYSLRITPGERRFAMLSGGEQTKLALAMTLAMVEEFSGLKFCIFDEPTYGVDADSRRKLADTILAVHEAAGLEQLLLVSHDDAFDGKIEHSIVLEKRAARGTIIRV